MKTREYKGYTIYPCDLNSSGMRYYAHGIDGYLRADTLAGIKQLITKEIG